MFMTAGARPKSCAIRSNLHEKLPLFFELVVIRVENRIRAGLAGVNVKLLQLTQHACTYLIRMAYLIATLHLQVKLFDGCILRSLSECGPLVNVEDDVPLFPILNSLVALWWYEFLYEDIRVCG